MRTHCLFGRAGLKLAAFALAAGLFGVSTLQAQTYSKDSKKGKETRAAAATTAPGTAIDVKLDEWKIDMPTTIAAGRTTFRVTNAGKHGHTLKIEGKDFEKKLENSLKSGETGELTVDLKPGTYEVICPIGFGAHKRKGMKLTLTVTGQTSEAISAAVPVEIAKADETVTMTGCLRAGKDKNTYMLESAARTVSTAASDAAPAELARTETSYALLAISGVNLKEHVGHKVEVSGKVEATALHTKTTATPAAVHTTTTALSRFHVHSVRMISENCQ